VLQIETNLKLLIALMSFKNAGFRRVLEAHVSNLTYSAGSDQENCGSKPA
jgi:hypothetical protein